MCYPPTNFLSKRETKRTIDRGRGRQSVRETKRKRDREKERQRGDFSGITQFPPFRETARERER